ncbi:plasmid mobilization protein [Rhizobium laguerreae]|uniref:plasmid mobilization protein n=1 Tax=Rhizobium laguerreae TaxID=1076926 RepID=UPI001FEB246A|nr:plasmid mobilization relaxosome protein MobC [Rhizobium laguerreae]
MRFSVAEMERIEDAAKRSGLTVSAFVRSLSLEGAGIRPFFTDEDRAILGLLLSEIRTVGVNLNQLARAIGRGRCGIQSRDKDVVAEVHRLLAAVLLELHAYAARGARTRSEKV